MVVPFVVTDFFALGFFFSPVVVALVSVILNREMEKKKDKNYKQIEKLLNLFIGELLR